MVPGQGLVRRRLYPARHCTKYPGYRLAELLAELVRRGTICGWAARREAAWQKFEPDAA